MEIGNIYDASQEKPSPISHMKIVPNLAWIELKYLMMHEIWIGLSSLGIMFKSFLKQGQTCLVILATYSLWYQFFDVIVSPLREV